jgi:putative endonuclease
MYYVYILSSEKLNKKYIGSTEDLKDRIRRHNSKGSKFTSVGVPWKLIYYEGFLNKDDALREEKFLKTGKGRQTLKFLLK